MRGTTIYSSSYWQRSSAHNYVSMSLGALQRELQLGCEIWRTRLFIVESPFLLEGSPTYSFVH